MSILQFYFQGSPTFWLIASLISWAFLTKGVANMTWLRVSHINLSYVQSRSLHLMENGLISVVSLNKMVTTFVTTSVAVSGKAENLPSFLTSVKCRCSCVSHSPINRSQLKSCQWYFQDENLVDDQLTTKIILLKNLYVYSICEQQI